MKNFLYITYIGLLLIMFISCTDSKKPTSRNVQYMADTDMYNSVPYETYSSNPIFKDGLSSQKSVEGTIARGQVIYEYPNTEAGYQLAKDSLQSPIAVNEKNSENGAKMFGIYCAICHGDKGDGQGAMVMNEKFLGVPNYKDRDITVGSTYHVIMYGRNLMGSHSSQLTETERWQVAQYVNRLRDDLIIE